jgi:hypothetical protein
MPLFVPSCLSRPCAGPSRRRTHDHSRSRRRHRARGFNCDLRMPIQPTAPTSPMPTAAGWCSSAPISTSPRLACRPTEAAWPSYATTGCGSPTPMAPRPPRSRATSGRAAISTGHRTDETSPTRCLLAPPRPRRVARVPMAASAGRAHMAVLVSPSGTWMSAHDTMHPATIGPIGRDVDGP